MNSGYDNTQIAAPLISICIPAYKNVDFLKRLLHSIAGQTFRNYEVVITDDSPDASVESFVKDYKGIDSLLYFRNSSPCGTPENWNAAIRKAKGKWIKMMHDDDWFNSRDALKIFAEASEKNKEIVFFFSAFQNVIEESGRKEIVQCSFFDRVFLSFSPLHLFKKVYVGNPSCTFIRRDIDLWYDNRFKYVVDFDYYILILKRYKHYHYIDEVLLNIGFNKEQVTKYTFLVPDIQIPENLLLLNKLGSDILKNVVVYDYYWRMFRNLKIRNVHEVMKYYSFEIPIAIQQMVKFQSSFSTAYLKLGVVSKLLMLLNYIRFRFTEVV